MLSKMTNDHNVANKKTPYSLLPETMIWEGAE